jgi:hypothetical protein
MTKTETIVVSILAVWLILSVLYPIFNRQMGIYTRRWDVFRWLSAYQLFSRTPRRFKLSYRDKLQDDATTDWQEIELTVRPKWFHVLWFPEELPVSNIRSLVDDLVSFLETRRDAPAIEKISRSFIFRTILRFVRRASPPDNLAARQFKIEEISGLLAENRINEVFVSELYD